ncbi:MAG: hypothetical protein COV73_04570 [Candidatus Omnitrophica bacterium CG11_big_fil_rev_8_21_14_0_20_43_6]|nr:MAG: hypothetical protein COV73_04570 [Candidatus Omnitrophica bacterium CG11_big_fil_rev_8_21_14_0_20_43_6]
MTILFVRKRRIKQYLSAPVFLAVIGLGWGFAWLGYFIPFCMLLGMGIGFLEGENGAIGIVPGEVFLMP